MTKLIRLYRSFRAWLYWRDKPHTDDLLALAVYEILEEAEDEETGDNPLFDWYCEIERKGAK